MGNFEHEKFIVNKEAESIKEMNDLIREVARLEMEIQRFRKLKGTLTHLESRLRFQDNKPDEKKKLEAEKQKTNSHGVKQPWCQASVILGIGNSVLTWKKVWLRRGKENTVFPLPDSEISSGL